MTFKIFDFKGVLSNPKPQQQIERDNLADSPSVQKNANIQKKSGFSFWWLLLLIPFLKR